MVLTGAGIAEVSPPVDETCASITPSGRHWETKTRAPSVSMFPIEKPSWVICVVPVTLGGLAGKRNQRRAAANSNAADAAATHGQRSFPIGASVAAATATLTLPEVVSRFSRFKSARISAAL